MIEFIMARLTLVIADENIPQKELLKYLTKSIVAAFPPDGPLNIVILEALVPHGNDEEQESELTKGKEVAIHNITELLKKVNES